ncbi:MAG: regulator [Candidatus Hydrogenedentes bacterium]|nr:regulator [Candidatus Hydrogenedentota bacterium]
MILCLRNFAVHMVLLVAACAPLLALEPAADTPFVQETHVAYPLPDDAANDVRAVAIGPDGTVWAATRVGAWSLRDGAWSKVDGASQGECFDIAVDGQGSVWIAAWDGLYSMKDGAWSVVSPVGSPIRAVYADASRMLAGGPDGVWSKEGDSWTTLTGQWPQSIRAMAPDADGGIWLATGMGLYRHHPSGDRLIHKPEDILTGALTGAAFGPDGRLYVGGLGGVDAFEGDKSVKRYTPADGLPTVEVKCLAFGPDGRLWVATTRGVTRFDGKSWSLRHSRRWLLDDEVRDVAFGPDGTAWLATRAGVSAIVPRTMTLAQKAAEFLAACEARHVREPGLVEKCRLRVAGDLSTWEPRDDDNDGQYTAMHLAAESYRYATTKDPDARAKASRAFRALEFLQTATGTPGFIARSVVPASWTKMADANEELSPERRAVGRAQDPRWKPVEQRWRPTADGKWLWKGDTSSDEMTGHFYGYYVYYTLAADEEDKERLRALVRRVMDHIIDGGFNLNDIDGTHTRWGVWAPEKLNGDPNWRAERGINSVEILSFLKTTYMITGDFKYEEHYRKLLHEHNYAENIRHAKTYAPSERTHIDDELLALAYQALLEQEKDPATRRILEESLDWWYKGLAHDESPYFNFLYGALGGKDFGRDAGVASLRDAPLDLVEWTVDNSRREDIRLQRSPEIDPLQTDRLLPPSERFVIRWDRNPWMAVNGEDGFAESSGTYWLLPYWMGRYYGYIAPAE